MSSTIEPLKPLVSSLGQIFTVKEKPKLPEKKLQTHSNFISATDQTPGKEGGTWLGCSKLGKIAALLNLDPVDYGKPEDDKLGRGFLVPNYLDSPAKSLNEYAERLKQEASSYNPFNLLLYLKNKYLTRFRINLLINVIDLF